MVDLCENGTRVIRGQNTQEQKIASYASHARSFVKSLLGARVMALELLRDLKKRAEAHYATKGHPHILDL